MTVITYEILKRHVQACCKNFSTVCISYSTVRTNDWLLPMLMNGQVTVKDACEQVEGVASMAAEDGVK